MQCGLFRIEHWDLLFLNLLRLYEVYISAITCPGLSEGVNTVNLTANEIDGLSYLESYTYTCIEGYTTTDLLTTLCQPDGSLSVTNPPTCTG